MKQPIVSKQIAIYLKQLGFNEGSYHYYRESENTLMDAYYSYNHNQFTGNVSAPTLDDTVRWLRDVKGVHVTVAFGNNYKAYSFFVDCINSGILIKIQSNFISHDEAQIAGIEAAIVYLKNQ